MPSSHRADLMATGSAAAYFLLPTDLPGAVQIHAGEACEACAERAGTWPGNPPGSEHAGTRLVIARVTQTPNDSRRGPLGGLLRSGARCLHQAPG